MSADPVSRVALAKAELDKTFGGNFARENPQVLIAVVNAASSDYAALAVARALQDVAAALLAEDDTAPHNGGLVRPQALVRP